MSSCLQGEIIISFMNITQASIVPEIEEFLINKQRQLKEELLELDRDDPVLANHVAEVSELGTESWEADVHAKLVLVKNNLNKMYLRVGYCLKMIKDGTYGSCEKCGKAISLDRLKALPTATYCSLCIHSS